MNYIKSPFQALTQYRSFFDPTESKILSFASFQGGWHYGDGIAFSESAIEDAIYLHRQIFFQGFSRTDAFPGPNGEIQVTVYSGNHYIQFEREVSGLWNISHEVNDQEIDFLPQKSFDQALDYVNNLQSSLCDISGVFTALIGTRIETNSMTWLSNQPKAEFPLLEKTAFSGLVQRSANTFAGGILSPGLVTR